MSDNNSNETIVVSGRQNVLNVRTLTIRRYLKLEIETGMSNSRGISLAQQANAISGGKSRSKRKAYADLDAWIVANLGMPSVPLRDAKK